MTGDSVEIAFVDQGYTGEQAAAEHGLSLRRDGLHFVAFSALRLTRMVFYGAALDSGFSMITMKYNNIVIFECFIVFDSLLHR